MARTGRRPGDSGTRQAILDAARAQFGERGFHATTIRGVAARAGVDPALVMHYFGSKDGLFGACVQWPFDPAAELPRLLADGPGEVGRRLVELFVRTWDDEQGANTVVALLRAAMTQEATRRLLTEFLAAQLFGPLTAALEVDRGELRASLAMSQLVGVGVARYLLRVEPLASLAPELVVASVAPVVQAQLTGPLPAVTPPSAGGRSSAPPR